MSVAPEVQALLQSWAGWSFGAAATLSGFQRLSGGASRRTFAFSVGDGEGAERYVLQVAPPPGRKEGVGSTLGIDQELAVLAAARAAGVPVPEVAAGPWPPDEDPGAERGIISRFVPGETVPRRVLSADGFRAIRHELLGQCVHALARIHSIAPARLPFLDADDQLARWGGALAAMGGHRPALEAGLRWLGRHRPPERPPVVLHGDFRLGNWIIEGGRLRAVIDWELAHLGSPAEDLGWMCVRAWRFGSDDPVAGLGGYEEMLRLYQAESGTRIEPEELRWWEALGCLKWAVICQLQAQRHLDGRERSVELAAIGRRTTEAEYDLMRVLS